MGKLSQEINSTSKPVGRSLGPEQTLDQTSQGPK